MRYSPVFALAVCLLAAGPSATGLAQGSLRSYTANYVATPPVIDGILTSATEWSGASDPQGEWSHFLNPSLMDFSGDQFAAVWNDDGLFFQFQSQYSAWSDLGRNEFNLAHGALALFMDPNGDDEPLDTLAPDSYVLLTNLPAGEGQILPEGSTVAKRGQHFVDIALPVDGGFSMFGNMQLRSNLTKDPAWGYVEMFLPWSDFDATNPETVRPGSDTGLFHPNPPLDGEEWSFNIAHLHQAQLAYEWQPGTGALLNRPFGLLQFSRGNSNPCDINGDGRCDDLDIDEMALAVGIQSTDPKYDLNADGSVLSDDRLFLVEELMNTYLGDSNLDGEFNSSDFVAVFLSGQYEDDLVGNSGWKDGDWNGDMEFNSTDFIAAFISGGYETGPRLAVSAVPEPGSIVLLAVGALLVISSRRRVVSAVGR